MNRSLLLAAALAMAEQATPMSRIQLDAFDQIGRQDPINTGRRAEKDAEALRKAQAKRDRKNAKRKEKSHAE